MTLSLYFIVADDFFIDIHNDILVIINIRIIHKNCIGTAVAQWLTCCATNRKVAGSNPNGVIGILL